MDMVRTTHHGWFFIFLVPQYVSTVVLGTNTNHGMFICLVGQYRSTRYGQIITACSSFLQCASTLLLQYWVQTTHQDLFFICLVGQYVSTVVRGIGHSSRIFLHLFSMLLRQYLSTWYGKLITACQCLSTLVPQYSARKTHRGLFFIRLARQYASSVVLDTDTHHDMFICLVCQCRSTRYGELLTACCSFVQCARTLVLQYLVQTTHHRLFYLCLVGWYVSTVVLSANNSPRPVLHLFSALVRQHRSTRYRR